jgi:hypothetical protein
MIFAIQRQFKPSSPTNIGELRLGMLGQYRS